MKTRKVSKHYGKLGGPHKGKKYDYDAAEQLDLELELDWWRQQDEDDDWMREQQDQMNDD